MPPPLKYDTDVRHWQVVLKIIINSSVATRTDITANEMVAVGRVGLSRRGAKVPGPSVSVACPTKKE